MADTRASRSAPAARAGSIAHLYHGKEDVVDDLGEERIGGGATGEHQFVAEEIAGQRGDPRRDSVQAYVTALCRMREDGRHEARDNVEYVFRYVVQLGHQPVCDVRPDLLVAAAKLPDVLIPLVAGLALAGAFAVHAARRRERPLIDLGVLRARSYAASVSVLFLAGLSVYGPLLLLALYYQEVQGASALVTGLLLAPQGGGSLLPGASRARSPTASARGRSWSAVCS